MIGVVIVSDVRVYRESVAAALLRKRRYDVMETTLRPRDALRLIRRRSPPVALVDLTATRGLGALRCIAQNAPAVTQIALAVEEEPNDIIACAEAGAAGYLPREASLEDLTRAIDDAADGTLQCSPRIAQLLFARVGQLAGKGGNPAGTALTPREIEILDLIEQGHPNKTIASRLGIEVSTVKNHVHAVLGKLGVCRRGEAAALRRRQAAGMTGRLN